MELQTYGKCKPPNVQEIRADILTILSSKVKGELPFVRATDLRWRACSKVKAPSFFALLKEMETDELLMISGVDETWAQCALWDHPRMVEWRIEREKWDKEFKEIEERRVKERRQREIENAPRLARERFQKELGEFFVDNSDEIFEVVRRVFKTYGPKKIPWLHSRNWL
jgi:ribosomal protein L29